MKELRFIASAAALVLFSTQVASAQDEPVGDSAETAAIDSPDPAATCFPPCRSGHVCHPDTLECVSISNPDDRRFRIALLGRFGLGGSTVVKFSNPITSTEGELKGENGATLGFDLRFEKPVATYVTIGGLISNYWLRAPRNRNAPTGIDVREVHPNDYALDVDFFVKPRYPFMAVSKLAEAYVIVQVGGSLRVAEIFEGPPFTASKYVEGGFNWGIAPGFQVFVTRHLGLIFEVGYARTWFKSGASLATSTKLGQATLRFGFSFAF